MKAIVNGDLVVGRFSGNGIGVDIAPIMQELDNGALRFDGVSIVDVRGRNNFYVDDLGIKHIDNPDSYRQPLLCRWDDVLENDNLSWRVRTVPDVLVIARKAKIADITAAFNIAAVSGFVTSSGIKMNTDIFDVQRLKSAYDLAVLMNQPVLPVVVDFNNIAHADMPLSDVLAMIIELGVNYQTLYAKKNSLRMQAMAAVTQADLDAVVW